MTTRRFGLGEGSGLRTRRAGWYVIDQAASSLTNFLVALVVARAVSVDDFGAFSVAYFVYQILIELLRAISLEPLVIKQAAASAVQQSLAVRSALAAGISAGIVGLPLAIVGQVAGGQIAAMFLALAVTLPGLLLQDSCRYSLFALGRPRAVFANDIVWGGLMVVALIGVRNHDSAWVYLLVWGSAGGLAGVFGLAQLRTTPSWTRLVEWIRDQRDLSPRFATEVSLNLGSFYAAIFIVGAVSGLAAVGALNAARVVMGPIGVLEIAATSFVVTEGARVAGRPRSVLNLSRATGAVLVTVAMLWGVALYALPENLGESLLGDTWLEARPILLVFAAFIAATGAVAGARGGLRAFAAASRSLRAQFRASLLVMATGIAGAFIGGARGAAAGLAIGGSIGAIFWWLECNREAHDRADLSGGDGPILGLGRDQE